MLYCFFVAKSIFLSLYPSIPNEFGIEENEKFDCATIFRRISKRRKKTLFWQILLQLICFCPTENDQIASNLPTII